MKPWRRVGTERLARCKVFDVDRVEFERPDGRGPRPFYRIESPDWINVIPLTSDRRVLLLKQYRFGVEDFTLEIPGGMCDPGEAPAAAALRELLEETGYAPTELVPLGWVHPNPALQPNRCHTFLAREIRHVGAPDPDPDEEFELSFVALDEIPGLIGRQRITHSLVVSAFHLLQSS